MSSDRRLIFLFDLLQDVNVLRPLILLARRRIATPIDLLVSWSFRARDTSGRWYEELTSLAELVGASLETFASEGEAWRRLAGKAGMVISASESSLGTHRVSHTVFRSAPTSLLRVTLQHGFECVGFRQNRAHDNAHGAHVTFAADVVCGWGERASMHSLARCQASKLVVTGPTALLTGPSGKGMRQAGPLICENLHSVRLRASPGLQTSFIETFLAFCHVMQRGGHGATLRPHPAGQYFAKNNLALPPYVTLEDSPAYALDFGAYAYGISAPSSVLIDMALAGLPVAVWQDAHDEVDVGNYSGLPVVSGLEDWLDFAGRATTDPAALHAGRQAFLKGTGLVTDRTEVERRFLDLLGLALPRKDAAPWGVGANRGQRPLRVLFIANGRLPTLDLYFTLPLAKLVETGKVIWTLLTEADLLAKHGKHAAGSTGFARVRQTFDDAQPDVIVFCRYSGPHAAFLLQYAQQSGVACLLHLDDDLLNVPIELGEAKFKFHNSPERLAAIRFLLEGSDLIFCSTSVLLRHLQASGFTTPMHSGPVAVGMDILRPATLRRVRKIGYMGFDHDRDFEVALPAIVRYLRRHGDVTLELFGRILRGPALEEFGERVVVLPPIKGYIDFREAFAARDWDIGICPLLDTPFNARKSDLKWAEYTAVGAAVVASAGTIYDECARGDCARLCDNSESWFQALDELTSHPERRFHLVEQAQRRLALDYSLDRMRTEVMGVLARAMDQRRGGRAAQRTLGRTENDANPSRIRWI